MGGGVSPPATREAATAARRANDERDPRPPTAGARGAVDGRGVKRAKGWGRGNRAPARQIVYVGLVAEGSARGKERHETERFLGLAGTFFHLGVSAALLSFSLSLPLLGPRLPISHSRFPPYSPPSLIVSHRSRFPLFSLSLSLFPSLFPPFLNHEPLPLFGVHATLSPHERRTYVRTYRRAGTRISIFDRAFFSRPPRGEKRRSRVSFLSRLGILSLIFFPSLSLYLSLRLSARSPLNPSPVDTGR